MVENLEPRTLFSADVVSASLALDFIADNSLEQHNWLADTSQSEFSLSNDKGDAYPIENSAAHKNFADVLNDSEAVYSSSELIGFEEQASDVIVELETALVQSRQLIVIDDRVDDSEALLHDVLNNGDSNTEFEIIRIGAGSDGIEAITSALSGQNNQTYDAVHIITHGDDAQLQLGATQLNSGNLQQFQSELSSWSSGLSLDADILLYGCDVAQTEEGRGLSLIHI